MKQLFLVCILILSSAVRADWVLVDETDEELFFYDPTTIRKDGNMRRVWRLQNFKQPDEDGVMSRRYHTEYDCKEERFRYLDISTHSQPMSYGKTLATGQGSREWYGIPPRTTSEIMLKIVCAK
jgi:hypothetical protein